MPFERGDLEGVRKRKTRPIAISRVLRAISDGRTDGQTNGRIDGRTDGRTAGRTN